MILLVCGGRDYANAAKVAEVLDAAYNAHEDGSFVLVNGGCRGADQLSSQWAKDRGLKSVIEVPIAKNPQEAIALNTRFDWLTMGRAAGPLRNSFMLDTYHPTHAVAFPGNDGTLDMLTKLFFAGVPTLVVGTR